MKSGIYFGRVEHRRLAPVEHGFSYRMFMLYLDLAELPRVFRGRWLWSTRRAALARFRREDHFGEPGRPLDECVRDLVAQETGARPGGPIRLLTHLSYFGYVFNPVSFYYCFDADDTRVQTIVAEVNNTPWGERHCYVLSQGANMGSKAGQGGHGRFFPRKVMHVSPFMEMDVTYDWRFGGPVHEPGSGPGGKRADNSRYTWKMRARGVKSLLRRWCCSARKSRPVRWPAPSPCTRP